ncbi:MAG: NAD(P)/FAD-dependent oxidoreductase [Pseudomonadota bacterium]
MSKSDLDLVIIGAGAAGLGASEAATAAGIEHRVLEASHRTGGRGLTEHLDGVTPIDLGCHWMHSASKNPYVKWADQLGFDYLTTYPQREFHMDGQQFHADGESKLDRYVDTIYERTEEYGGRNEDRALLECFGGDHPYLSWAMYWVSLMHSNDPDQVSLMDAYHYVETGEDYPLKQGYGALISKQGHNCPVELNTQVLSIDWSATPIRIETNHGVLRTQKLILTVSTGVLAANDIVFNPALPDWKQDAINALPLGNYNNLFFSFEPDTFDGREWNIGWSNGEQNAAVQISQFGQPYLFCTTAGRFAWWLEKQGERASEDYLRNILIDLFGSDINKKLKTFKASAWGFDPWFKGAYSSAKPGQWHQREALARPINESIYFAGEATSQDFLNTAHGAYLSGHRAVGELSGDV